METRTIEIEKLASWSDSRRIDTAKGPRRLRTARPTSRFWDVWRSDKDTLKAAGISCGKNRDGEWEACWWLPLEAAEQAQRDDAIASSRATDAEIDVPVPDGLSYMPFQRAGIAYAMGRQNVLFGDEMGLGEKLDGISGADFHKLWADDREKAKEYLGRDLELTKKLDERILPKVEN